MKFRWPIWSFWSWRRPARALERIASALEDQNALLRRHWELRTVAPAARKPAAPHVTIEAFDVAGANKRYHDELKAAMLEPED